MLHLKFGTLHQELEMLVLKLRTWTLHRCTTQKLGSDKLTGLWKAGPSIASGMLARKNHLAFAILFHFLKLVLDGDGLVNQILKIKVIGVEQLELDLIIETLKKCILLLLVGADIISGIPR
jgi:hypothetical protein